MTTESYILVTTCFFTAIAAVSAYLSVTRGATWAAKNLDEMDPVKQRVLELQKKQEQEAKGGSKIVSVFTVHLITGQFLLVMDIHNVGYQAFRVMASFSNTHGGAINPNEASVDILIRYSSVASISID